MKDFLYKIYVRLNDFICNIYPKDDLRNNKSQTNYAQVIIQPEITVKEKADKYFCENTEAPEWIKVFEDGFIAPAVYYIHFSNATLISKGLLLNEKKRILLESAFFQQQYLNLLRVAPLLIKNIFVGPHEKISHVIPLMHRLSNNYYHWTAEQLSRIALLKNFDNNIHEKYYLLINDTAPKFVEQSLISLVKWPADKIIRHGQKAISKVNDCIQLSYPGTRNATTKNYYAYPPYIFRMLNKLSLENISEIKPGNIPARILLSRSKAIKRRIVNEDELENKLSATGVKKVNAEVYEFAEQVNLFKEAQFIVAPHGAGLTNILYCNPRAVIVELFPQGRKLSQTHYYHQISKALGLYYHLIVVPVINKDEDMYIDDSITTKILSIYNKYFQPVQE